MTISTFWEALELDAASPPVVAIVGGGGKTSLLFRLGREARDRGLAAVLTGTTRFTTPASRTRGTTLLDAADKRLDAIIEAAGTAVLHAGREPKGRWTPATPAAVDALAARPGLGLLAIEADGSKMRPFKAPANHEPVIPDSATHVVAVVGLRALDASLDGELVHRPERVRAIVGPEDQATSEVIARVLSDERGGRRQVGDRRFAVLVNQAELDPARAHGLAQVIRAAGVPRVIVASLNDEASPIRETLA